MKEFRPAAQPMQAVSLLPAAHPQAVNALTVKVACSNCNLRELCMPVCVSLQELARIDEVVATRRKVKRGITLFRNGEAFESLSCARLFRLGAGAAHDPRGNWQLPRHELETVSRTFSKFADDGIIEVRQRLVRILNAPELQRIVNQQSG